MCSYMKCSSAFLHFMMVRTQPRLAHTAFSDARDAVFLSSYFKHRNHRQDVRKDPARPAALPRRGLLERAFDPDRPADARSRAAPRRERRGRDQAPPVLREDRLAAARAEEDPAAVQAERAQPRGRVQFRHRLYGGAAPRLGRRGLTAVADGPGPVRGCVPFFAFGVRGEGGKTRSDSRQPLVVFFLQASRTMHVESPHMRIDRPRSSPVPSKHTIFRIVIHSRHMALASSFSFFPALSHVSTPDPLRPCYICPSVSWLFNKSPCDFYLLIPLSLIIPGA